MYADDRGLSTTANLVLFGGARTLRDDDSGKFRFRGTTNDVHVFDVHSGTWKKVTPLGRAPSKRAAHAAVAMGSTLIVQGGLGPLGPVCGDLQVLDFSDFDNPKWSRMPVVGDGPGPRYGHTLDVVSNRYLVVMFGRSDMGVMRDAWALDMCEQPYQWTKIFEQEDLPPARMYASSATFRDGRLLLCGGRNALGVPLEDTFAFVRHCDGRWEWTRASTPMPTPRSQHTAVLVNSRLHIAGGADRGSLMVNAELSVLSLDTTAGVWCLRQNSVRRLGDQMSRSRHAATSVGGTVFVYGGFRARYVLDDFLVGFDGPIEEMEIGDPASPAWQSWRHSGYEHVGIRRRNTEEAHGTVSEAVDEIGPEDQSTEDMSTEDMSTPNSPAPSKPTGFLSRILQMCCSCKCSSLFSKRKQSWTWSSEDGVSRTQSSEDGVSRTQSSEDGTSCSSESEEWTADAPCGSRRRMLKAIEVLKPGHVFIGDFVIRGGNIASKQHIRLAQRKSKKQDEVILKFYWVENLFENALEVHPRLVFSDHVCKMYRPLRTQRTNFPPCIVFERGTQTLSDWLIEEQSLVDRKWCLHQILCGIRDVHIAGIVHCDVKPSNVMFFIRDTRWKLIDLDGAQTAGTGTVITFDKAYAPPEIIREFKEKRELPVAQQSMDIWSFGILAYEVITGKRFFRDDIELEGICELIESGVVERSLEQVQDEMQREALSNFLNVDPQMRWTANNALKHSTFLCDNSTTTTSLSTSDGSFEYSL